MYFSISAPQDVTLPDGRVLSFRVNAQDSSLCEMHIIGKDADDTPGTHILTFKRNGGPQETSFTPVAAIPTQPAYADAPSVDKDAVRADAWSTKTPYTDKDAKTELTNDASKGLARDRFTDKNYQLVDKQPDAS